MRRGVHYEENGGYAAVSRRVTYRNYTNPISARAPGTPGATSTGKQIAPSPGLYMRSRARFFLRVFTSLSRIDARGQIAELGTERTRNV